MATNTGTLKRRIVKGPPLTKTLILVVSPGPPEVTVEYLNPESDIWNETLGESGKKATIVDDGLTPPNITSIVIG